MKQKKDNLFLTDEVVEEKFGRKFLLDKIKGEFFLWGMGVGIIISWVVVIIIFLAKP